MSIETPRDNNVILVIEADGPPYLSVTARKWRYPNGSRLNLGTLANMISASVYLCGMSVKVIEVARANHMRSTFASLC